MLDYRVFAFPSEKLRIVTERLHMERGRFTHEAKEMVHERAQGKCELNDHGVPNNGIVHHITGVYEGYLKGVPAETLSDPDLNAIMLCDSDALKHDEQERYQVECLIYEGRNFREIGRRRNKRTMVQRRRRR